MANEQQSSTTTLGRTPSRLLAAAVLLLCSSTGLASAFAPPATFRKSSSVGSSSSSALSAKQMPERVLLVGPSLLQLVVAKALKARGVDPLLVCPTDKMEKFTEFIQNGLDDEADAAGRDVMSSALYGLPEESDPEGYGWREGVTAVVVCAEDAVIGKAVIDRVMSWDGFGNDRSKAVDGPDRAILCAPITSKVNKEKSMGWMPIFNNDRNEQKVWDNLVKGWYENPYVKGDKGSCQASTIRFGSLFGGGPDGPPELAKLGLSERCYKMSLEQYRDLRERSFDRFRLAAQVLDGDAVNLKPESQEEREAASGIKGEDKEAYMASGGYPEVDRTNRHTLAQAVCEAVGRPVRGPMAQTKDDGSVPEEMTVLSKSVSALPTEEEWDGLFGDDMGPAQWPDPAKFVRKTVEEQASA